MLGVYATVCHWEILGSKCFSQGRKRTSKATETAYSVSEALGRHSQVPMCLGLRRFTRTQVVQHTPEFLGRLVILSRERLHLLGLLDLAGTLHL